MRVLRMLAFHTRLFAGNSYFVQLMVTSTVTILLMQYVASFASHSPESASSAWLRAGLVGTWTVCTVAAGLIGFQRFQGTLVHLVFTPTRAGSTLLPLVGSASAFGLLAFPLTGLLAWILRLHPQVSWQLVPAVFVFWLACLSISCAVAALFVLTPYAMTYEGLLVAPLILVSGIFGIPASIEHWAVPVSFLLPTSSAVRAVLDAGSAGTPEPSFWGTIVLSVAVSLAWFTLSTVLLKRALVKAHRDASLEVM